MPRVWAFVGYAARQRIEVIMKQYSDWYLLSILRAYPVEISPIKFNEAQYWPHYDTYIRRFGSWSKAKELAHDPKWTEDLAA